MGSLSQPGGGNMRLPLNRALDVLRISCLHRISLKGLTGNLARFAIGGALAVIFVLLLLAPVDGYAARAKQDAAAVAPNRRSIAGASAPARDQPATFAQLQPVEATAAELSAFSADVPAYTLVMQRPGKPVPMVRLPGHMLPARATATAIKPADAFAEAAQANQPLVLTVVRKRADQKG